MEFSELLPPLSTDEFAALKADIKEHGVLHPIFVDEDGKVLDGRHRLKIDNNAPRKVVRGLSPAEKEAFVFRCNFVRRNLSPDQKKEAHRKMKKTAKLLREDDAKKWTQKRIAEAFGVGQQTVSDWFTTNTGIGNGSKPKPRPDARVKVAPEAKSEVAARVEAGEPQAQVAADVGVSQQAISRIVKAERKQAEKKRESAKAARKIKTDCGVLHGDFRKQNVASESVQLIFTDPPYDEKAVALYADLAKLASDVLVKGGWCLAYSGQQFLPDVLSAMSAHLTYGWTFGCLHSGGDLRFRKYKLHNKWKPIVGFYKPPLSAWWDWFPDIASGGREKTDHEWQQAESEAAHFIESLSTPGGLVFDPMCGSGTTLVAAKTLLRKWLGTDIDKSHVQTARVKVDGA